MDQLQMRPSGSASFRRVATVRQPVDIFPTNRFRVAKLLISRNALVDRPVLEFRGFHFNTSTTRKAICCARCLVPSPHANCRIDFRRNNAISRQFGCEG